MPSWAVVDSSVLGERVLFVWPGARVPGRHASLPTYTADELDALLEAKPTPDDLRAVHAAKRALGGTVVPPRAESRPTACPGCGGRLAPDGRCGWCG